MAFWLALNFTSDFGAGVFMKRILALILVLILSVGAMPNGVFVFAERHAETTSTKAETSIAEIPNDDYVPYQYNQLSSRDNALSKLQTEVEAIGGYTETYGSVDEYIKNREVAACNETSQTEIASETFNTVMKTITVMTTATGSLQNGNYVPSRPIADAIVRLDGVPRYTDNDGQVTAQLSRKYVEMYIERDGYNPYIEIIDANEGDKTVNLKKPSDDIDVFAVMLEYDDDTVNLLNQEYGVDLYSQDDDLTAKITVVSNIEPDKVILYKNGEEYLQSNTQVFENIDVCDFSVGDILSVKVMKADIWSESLNLQIKFVDCSKLDFAELLGVPEDDRDINIKNDNARTTVLAKSSEDEGTLLDKTIGAGLNLGINTAIRELLKKYGSAAGKNAANTQKERFVTIIFDSRHNTAKIILGVDLYGSKNNGTIPGENAVMSRNSALKCYESFQRSYRATISSRANKKNPVKVLKGMMNGFKLLTQPGKFYPEKVSARQFGVTVFGFLEIGYSNGISIRDFGVSVDLDFSFTITGTLMIVVVPCYWYFEMGAEVSFKFQAKRIDEIMKFVISIDPNFFMRVGAGAGINGIASVGGALQLELDIDNEFATNGDDKSFNSSGYVNLTSWLEISFLFYSGRFFEHDWFSIKLWDTWKDKGIERQGQALIDGIQLSPLRNSKLSQFSDKYELAESRPQIVSLAENKQLIVWIGNDPARDDYNFTTLYYATVEDGIISSPQKVADDGTADFCPTLIKHNNAIYIAWQNSQCIFGEDATVDDVSSNMEIAIAEFNVASNSFVKARNLTNNGYLDAIPKFVSNNDNLFLVWQANSESNIFFNSGINSFYYAALNNGQWDPSTLLLTTDDVIVDYSASVIKESIALTYCADTDDNIATYGDREIICKTGALQKVVSGASTPLCVDNGEVLGLYYLKNGIVYYMPDINEQEHIVPTTGLLSCVTEYKLISKNQIVYKTSSGKLYYSYLNDTEWVSGAVILDDYSAQINYFSAAYDGYDINIVTLNTVDDKYCLKASSYTVLNDLAIEDVIVPYAFSISEPNEITIILHNKGTYPISEFEVLIDGLVCDYVVLLKPILPSQMYSFEYTLVLNDLVPITISIQTPYMEDANSDNNIFRIDTRICEIAITSINKEGVKLFYTIKNYSDFDVDILITFRLLNMTDSPELRSSINITKGATIVVEVNLQEFNIVQTGCIDVCVMADILSDEKLLYPVSSSYETQINLGMVAETNQYIDILNKTKRYL